MQAADLGAAEVVVGPGNRFSVGGALSRSFAAWKRNWPFLLGVAVLSQLPGFLVSVTVKGGTGFFSPATRLETMLDSILGYVATGLVTVSVLDQLRGRSRNNRRSLSLGASRLWPLVWTAIGTGFVTGLLFLLLVIPGLIAMVCWVLVAPIAILEPGVDVWGRSIALTRGHRWGLFGILVVFHGGMLVVLAAVGAATGFMGGLVLGSTQAVEDSLLLTAVTALPAPLFVSFRSVLEVVLYEQLRAEKEGVDVTQLAAVFE
jgi:hypothetical protein